MRRGAYELTGRHLPRDVLLTEYVHLLFNPAGISREVHCPLESLESSAAGFADRLVVEGDECNPGLFAFGVMLLGFFAWSLR